LTRLRIYAPRLVALAALLAAAGWIALHRDAVSPAAMAQQLQTLGFWAPLIFVVIYALGAVVLFPAALFSLAGGAAFGPVWGSLLDLAGATLGAGAAFLAARYLAGAWVQRRVGGRLGRLVAGVEAEGWRFVAAARLVPIIPYTLLNYAFGLTRIGFWPYLGASAVCMIPGSIAYTWLGYAGREAASGDASAIRYGLLGLAVLALAAFVPRIVKRARASA
jgi:uncharacterized membrane protein YdjX (TVP38/TMEM64 family)